MLRIRGVADASERLIWFEPAQHVLGSEIGLGIGVHGVREAPMQLSQELRTVL